MHKRELYDRLLGLSAPWFVAGVKLDTESQQVDVLAEHAQGAAFCCRECGKECSVYDRTAERQRWHLDTMQLKTVLHAKLTRVEWEEHGIKQVALPWAGKNSRFTRLYERLAIDVLQATQTVKGAQGILGTTWDETWHPLRQALSRGKARKAANPMP